MERLLLNESDIAVLETALLTQAADNVNKPKELAERISKEAPYLLEDDPLLPTVARLVELAFKDEVEYIESLFRHGRGVELSHRITKDAPIHKICGLMSTLSQSGLMKVTYGNYLRKDNLGSYSE